MIRQLLTVSCITCTLAPLGACSDGDSEGEATGTGRDYYTGSASAALGSETNQADCQLCHTDDGTQAGHSGKSFKDIAYRTSFKGGDAPNLLAASNACVTGWMGGAALTPEDPEWIELEGFLQSISDSGVTAPNVVVPEVLEDEAAYEAAYMGGDATAGQAKYQAYCGSCHGTGLVVGASPAWPLTSVAAQAVGRIAQKVRTSGPPPSGMMDASDTTPGPMPFFEPSDLPESDLKDIIAFIKSQG